MQTEQVKIGLCESGRWVLNHSATSPASVSSRLTQFSDFPAALLLHSAALYAEKTGTSRGSRSPCMHNFSRMNSKFGSQRLAKCGKPPTRLHAANVASGTPPTDDRPWRNWVPPNYLRSPPKSADGKCCLAKQCKPLSKQGGADAHPCTPPNHFRLLPNNKKSFSCLEKRLAKYRLCRRDAEEQWLDIIRRSVGKVDFSV
jgi:hypothetical protein